MTDFSNLNKEFYICAKCGYCRENCPARRFMGFETYSARGKILVLRRFLEKSKPFTKELVDNFYSCAACGLCKEMCPVEIDLPELFVDVRADLVEKGLGPLPPHVRFAQSIKENHNPYLEPHGKRTSWLPEKLPQKVDMIFFAGCTNSFRTQSTALSTFRILKEAGVNFGVMSDEWCCGSPLLMTGQKEGARVTVEHNAEAIESSGAGTLITSCSGCYRMWKVGYEKISHKKLPFEVFHTSEYMQLLLDEKKLKPLKEINKKVTYHDPCHLGRHVGVFDPPRAVLESIPGIKLLEMERTRKLSWCCGAGAGVMSGIPDLAHFAAMERLNEAKETGAEMIVSACPFCELNLSRTAESVSLKLPVVDVTELFAQSLG